MVSALVRRRSGTIVAPERAGYRRYCSNVLAIQLDTSEARVFFERLSPQSFLDAGDDFGIGVPWSCSEEPGLSHCGPSTIEDDQPVDDPEAEEQQSIQQHIHRLFRGEGEDHDLANQGGDGEGDEGLQRESSAAQVLDLFVDQFDGGPQDQQAAEDGENPLLDVYLPGEEQVDVVSEQSHGEKCNQRGRGNG